ncbi:MAG: hypothetical protein DRP64_19020, partial [Verrucomicrobia bacterium]
NGEFLLQGPTSNAPPGTLSLFEIDAGDYTSVTNLEVGTLSLWSSQGGDMELSIYNGTVEAKILKMVAWGYEGTINMGNGTLHALSNDNAYAQFNMLADGTGDIIIDSVETNMAALLLDFESGNEGSFTFGDKAGGPAGGLWEGLVGNGNVSIDGVPTTSLLAYQITTIGDSTKISLPGPLGPLESYLVWMGSFGLTDTNTTAAMTADPDGDGVANLSEYAMLGDPIDPNVQGTTPEAIITNVGGTNYFACAHYERTNKDDMGLSYAVERNVDLVTGTWTNDAVYPYGAGAYNADFNVATNFTTMDEGKQFMRLRVEFQE